MLLGSTCLYKHQCIKISIAKISPIIPCLLCLYTIFTTSCQYQWRSRGAIAVSRHSQGRAAFHNSTHRPVKLRTWTDVCFSVYWNFVGVEYSIFGILLFTSCVEMSKYPSFGAIKPLNPWIYIQIYEGMKYEGGGYDWYEFQILCWDSSFPCTYTHTVQDTMCTYSDINMGYRAQLNDI